MARFRNEVADGHRKFIAAECRTQRATGVRSPEVPLARAIKRD